MKHAGSHCYLHGMFPVAIALLAMALAACRGGGGAPVARAAVAAPPTPREGSTRETVVRPSAARPPAMGGLGPPVDLAVLLEKDGVWVGTTVGARQRVARCPDGLDRAALRQALCAFANAPELVGRHDVEIAAGPGVSYGDAIRVMDVAIDAGFLDIGLVDPAALPVRFPGTPTTVDLVFARCHAAPAPCTPAIRVERAPASPADRRRISIDLPPPSGESWRIPIIAIGQREISLNGRRVTTIAEVSALAEGQWQLDKLFAALQRERKGVEPEPGLGDRAPVVLQADHDTDARIFNRVVGIANAAGFTNIMFAVSRQE